MDPEADPRHHPFGPLQRFGRGSAAQDDEVVGVGDDPGSESRAGLAGVPVAQEAVHVDVGQERAQDAALRRPVLALLASRHAPPSSIVPLFDGRFQPHLDQMQHMAVHHAAGHRLQQIGVRDRLEILRQIGIHHIGVAVAQGAMDLLDGPSSAAARSVAVGFRQEIRLEDRLQHQLRRRLDHPVSNRRDAERAFAASGLRDLDPTNRVRSIRSRTQLLSEPPEPVLQALRFDRLEGHPVHPRGASIRARHLIGMGQNVLAVHLVVEPVEPERRLGLRLGVELPLKPLDLLRSREPHRQSPDPWPRRKHPEVRPRPSTGVTRLPRYHGPLRLPHEPPPRAASRAATPRPCGDPTLRTGPFPHAVPTTPLGCVGASVGCFPTHIGLPRISGGSTHAPSSLGSAGTPDLTFGACSGFTRVTAYRIANPAKPDLVPRGFDGSVALPAARVATESNRQLLRWISHPLVLCALVAH